MKTADLYTLFRQKFRTCGFDSPDLEAAWILEDVTRSAPGSVPVSDHELTESEQKLAESFLARRLKQEPYQYIFGHAAFRDLDLLVGPGCLIPRPETEVLVDHILEDLPQNADICELGTGSGAIALSLAKERPDLRICASEKSPDALAWALKNRDSLRLDRVQILNGDLFSPFSGMTFDVIAANLPYIAEKEKSLLPENVRDYEPAEALFAPDDGFALLERTIREAPGFLKEHGRLCLEIGETQAVRCLNKAAACHYARTEIRADQYGIPRFILAVI